MSRESRYSFDKDADWKYTKEPYYKPCTSGLEMTRGQEIVLIAFAVIMTIIAITCCVVWGIKAIQMNSYQIEESKRINAEKKYLYESKANVNEYLMTKEEMENSKKMYEKEELEFQQQQLIKAHTKLAKELCPIGSYVWIKNYGGQYGIYVRVKGYEGLEAMTYENINFNVAELETWEFIDMRNYVIQCQVQDRVAYISKNIK